ncbi:MAG: hypothetical protein ACRC76_15545 [Proteocatella sp.]
MAKKEKSNLRELINEYGLKALNAVHNFVKIDKIIFIYSQDSSTRDIQAKMTEGYGIKIDDSRVL